MSEIVSCSKVIALHSLESRSPVHSYSHHRGIVNSVSVNHTSKVIASCGQDGRIVLVTTERPDTKLLDNHFHSPKDKPVSLSACAFSPNSKYLAVGSVDSLLKVWDLRGQQKEQTPATLKSHMCGITSLAWIRHLRAELAGSDILASSSSSGDIFLHSNKQGAFAEVMALKLQEGINCIRTSEASDYCRLAACTNAGTLAVWDLMSGKDKPVWSISSSEARPSMTSLSISTFSPVLLVTASVDQTLTFFDILQKKSVKKIAAEQPLSCVGLHSNGHTLVAGGMYGNCFLYDLRNPHKPLSKLLGHQSTVKCLEFIKGRDKEVPQKASKAPSVSNSNHVVTGAHIDKVPTVSQSTSDKTKQNIKVPDPKVNNFTHALTTNPASGSGVNSSAPIRTAPLAEDSQTRDKSKLSYEVVRPNTIKIEPPNMSKVESPPSYHDSSTEPFRPRGRQSVRQEPGELRELREKVGALEGALRQVHGDMFEMEERLNLAMVRQFQLQQAQIRGLLQGLVSRQRQKDEQIRRLEIENRRLRDSTF